MTDQYSISIYERLMSVACQTTRKYKTTSRMGRSLASLSMYMCTNYSSSRIWNSHKSLISMYVCTCVSILCMCVSILCMCVSILVLCMCVCVCQYVCQYAMYMCQYTIYMCPCVSVCVSV